MSFGFSLYSGWVGTALCLLGGCMIACCSVDTPATYTDNNRFYYSKQGPAQSPASTNHAKSAHVWASGSDFYSVFAFSLFHSLSPLFLVSTVSIYSGDSLDSYRTVELWPFDMAAGLVTQMLHKKGQLLVKDPQWRIRCLKGLLLILLSTMCHFKSYFVVRN